MRHSLISNDKIKALRTGAKFLNRLRTARSSGYPIAKTFESRFLHTDYHAFVVNHENSLYACRKKRLFLYLGYNFCRFSCWY